ncbi:unnamed protein product [Prorocentrum cordatum]|nr:unnamed protein product [Polarella glacialis]
MREHERQCERAGVRQKAGPLWPARACERLRGNSRGKEGRGRDRERKRPASSAWATVASAAERHWKTSSRDHDDLMHRSISSHAKPRRRPQPCNLLEGEEEEGEEEEEESTPSSKTAPCLRVMRWRQTSARTCGARPRACHKTAATRATSAMAHWWLGRGLR